MRKKTVGSGYGGILLLSAIDLLIATLAATLGLFVVLTGTSPLAAASGQPGSSVGFSGSFVDVYSVEEKLSPLRCGRQIGLAEVLSPDAYPLEEWSSLNVSENVSDRTKRIMHWTYGAIGGSHYIRCSTEDSASLNVYVIVSTATGKPASEALSCPAADRSAGVTILRFSYADSRFLHNCNGGL